MPIELTDNTLTVATANPFEIEAIDRIGRITGYKVVIATKADIMRIITEFYGFKSSVVSAHKEIDSKTDLGNLEQYIKLKSILMAYCIMFIRFQKLCTHLLFRESRCYRVWI